MPEHCERELSRIECHAVKIFQNFEKKYEQRFQVFFKYI